MSVSYVLLILSLPPFSSLMSLTCHAGEWSNLGETSTGAPPSPRQLTAVANIGSHLLFLGGCRSANGLHTCYNDLHVLDSSSLKWSSVETEGSVPTERRGAALLPVSSSRLYGFGGCHPQDGCDGAVFQVGGPIFSLSIVDCLNQPNCSSRNSLSLMCGSDIL